MYFDHHGLVLVDLNQPVIINSLCTVYLQDGQAGEENAKLFQQVFDTIAQVAPMMNTGEHHCKQLLESVRVLWSLYKQPEI